MKILDSLLGSVKDDMHESNRVRVGLFWTFAEGRYGGMSHTFKSGQKVDIEDAGDLSRHTSIELAQRCHSSITVEASIGIAALNSLIEPLGEEGSINDHIMSQARGKVVTVIGRFPFNDEIRRRAKKAYILEIEPKGDELPASACDEVLPRSDVNVITATTIINHTLQGLLELGSGGENILLGPSTPMSPLLFDHGIDVLAGVQVVDFNAIEKSVVEGVKKFSKLGGVEPICLFKRDGY